MTNVFKINTPDGISVNAADLANQLGIPVDQLPADLLEFFRNAPALIQNNKNAIREIIHPFYDEAFENRKKNGKKHLEILDVGKFIYYNSLPGIRLLEASESPDFVIEYDGERIGLEHTQLFKKDEQHALGKTISLLTLAEDFIRHENPGLRGLYNVAIATDKISVDNKPFILLTKLQLKGLARIVAEYISALDTGKTVSRPAFLDLVTRYDQDLLHLALSETFIKGWMDGSTLQKRIEQKEAKIVNYKKNKNLVQCWLLIVYTTSVSSSSFYINPGVLPTDSILFDKIFLMDSFQGSIIEGRVVR
jgi:hypothetical protein